MSVVDTKYEESCLFIPVYIKLEGEKQPTFLPFTTHHSVFRKNEHTPKPTNKRTHRETMALNDTFSPWGLCVNKYVHYYATSSETSSIFDVQTKTRNMNMIAHFQM